ncbi:hypothetical protein VTN00DRAFT_1255 [Thermoascus crustaceus]|uniref:uncharacterized protein n=1 Tax=Thermoascus crustaceus TaxID=5088 RepID=UPI003743A15B
MDVSLGEMEDSSQTEMDGNNDDIGRCQWHHQKFRLHTLTSFQAIDTGGRDLIGDGGRFLAGTGEGGGGDEEASGTSLNAMVLLLLLLLQDTTRARL